MKDYAQVGGSSHQKTLTRS